jgi:hypothetical protein
MRAARLFVRVAVVLLLGLTALLLAVDHAEYRALSRAGLRVFAQGVLPLGLTAALNLHALDAGRRWRLAALVADVAVLAVGVRMLRPGAPPFAAILTTVGLVLVLAMAAWLLASRRAVRNQ